jgi:hypothetical protein
LLLLTCRGDEGICVGGVLSALGADIALTPLVVYGLGELMGGDGRLSRAYMGAMSGMAIGGIACAARPESGLAVGVLLMPFTSAAGYEISSGQTVAAPAPQSLALRPSVAPIYSRHGIDGVSATVAGAF